MHCHTRYSPDGFITQPQLIKHCRKKNIHCVCITDHNTIQGITEFARQTNVRIIPGEEIKTQAGEIIGLFLKKEIPPNLTLGQTIEKIKQQNGIVYLPHPFDEFRKSAVKFKDAETIKTEIDIVEIFNSRTFNPKCNAMTLEFATQNNIVTAVGSDAHHPFEIGNSLMQMNDFDGRENFLENLKNATYISKKCPLVLRLYIKGLKILTGKD